MRKFKRFSMLVVISLLLSAVAIAPTSAGTVQAGGSFVYNLYATDAYIPLADGSAVYNYGFVGGRPTQTTPPTPFVFQRSVIPGTVTDTVTGLATSFTYNGNGSIANGVPAPTGGPVIGDEASLQGNAQFPAPLIYAVVGDIVEIRLKNLGTTVAAAPNDPHSIHLHGLDVDAANDGVPETSVGAIPANLCSDGNTAAPGASCVTPAPGAGNVVVYMFSPKFAGTTMYHCHQEASIHVQMGMYGALVVYNRGDPAAITGPGTGKGGGTLYGWKYDKDYVLLESEIGPAQHVSEEISGVYNPVDYHPTYWFLNGLSFPNTIHVGLPELTQGTGWSDWIAAHPGYDPFIKGSVSKTHPGTSIPKGDKVLIRMINMGYETQPMHMHAFHGKVIGSDQRAWYWSNVPQQPFGLGLEKNTLTIGSGETYDWLVNFGEQALNSTYPVGTQTRYDPATKLPVVNTQTNPPAIRWPAVPTGDPYIPGPKVCGAVGPGPDPVPCTSTSSQLFPFHNHDDYKATNNGSYPGGMFTMLMPTP